MLFPVRIMPRTLVTATENSFGNQNFSVDFATTQMHLFMQSNLGSLRFVAGDLTMPSLKILIKFTPSKISNQAFECVKCECKRQDLFL